MLTPAESRIVNFALVKPDDGESNVKVAHSAIAEVAEQPILGTEPAPENVARLGAMALQPNSPVRIFTVLNTGFECCVTHKQFGIAGSGVTV